MKPNHRTIRFVPSIRKGNGTGHLRRCLEMAAAINNQEGSVSAQLLLETGGETLSTVDHMLRAYPQVPVSFVAPGPARDPAPEDAKITVLDSRANSQARVEELRSRTIVVGYDEEGPGRRYCHYLIDTLPAVTRRSEPNVIAAAVRAPRNRRSRPPEEFHSIILTFGGEDPAGLTPIVCRALVKKLGFAPEHITAVRGPSAKRFNLPAGVCLLDNPESLREMLYEYDLVITSFGLTAYEALAAGVPVLVVNPTNYHKKLSKIEGFEHAGVRRVRTGKLRRLMRNPAVLAHSCEALRSRLEGSRWVDDAGGLNGELAGAAGVIAGLTPHTPAHCPVCGGAPARSHAPGQITPDEAAPASARTPRTPARRRPYACPPGTAVARFPDRTFFRCTRTGLLWLSDFSGERTAYGESYFFSEYQAQYGKTYLEDFDYIKGLAGPRLQAIRSLLPDGAASILDVGCAYGPFLSAAADAGFRCYGIDISPPAVAYVTGSLGLDAVVADFSEFNPDLFEPDHFNCISMWYVIEHFENLKAVLEAAAALLRPGGVFAFSTPNSSGISGRLSLKRLLRSSPRDHYTVWSPRSAKTLLGEFGFSVKKIRITGHHPERFPLMANRRSGILYKVVMAASRLFGLGDTFEVYAVRDGERGDA